MGFIKTTFAVIGVTAGSYAVISSAMAANLTRTQRLRSEETPESVGLEYGDVSFTSRGGDAKLSGWIITPESGSNSSHTTARGTSWVIIIQGDNTNRSDARTGTLRIARSLSRRGFGIFMFDMRGRGDSPAAMSSSGYFERLDLQGASDYLVSKGADRSRIGVLGFSLGGAVALMAGSNPNNFGAVVSDSSFADYSLILRNSMTGIKRPFTFLFPGMEFMAKTIYGIDLKDISPARSIARSDTPVLVIHGEDDTVIPVEHARLLGRAIGASFKEIDGSDETIWIVPGAGHLGSFTNEPKAYIKKLVKFYEAHLGAPHSSHLTVTDNSEKPETSED